MRNLKIFEEFDYQIAPVQKFPCTFTIMTDRDRGNGIRSVKNDGYHFFVESENELSELNQKYQKGGIYNGETITSTSVNPSDYGTYNESTNVEPSRIKTSDFVQSIRDLNDEEFEYLCEDESVKNALSTYLGNEHGNFFEDLSVNYESFPYEIVDVLVEKGDYKDEETTTGIFKRLSDGKYFALIIHDAGQIGPETLTVREWMYEVKPKKVTITKWS